jgi:hypothetical protein
MKTMGFVKLTHVAMGFNSLYARNQLILVKLVFVKFSTLKTIL